MKYNEYMKSLGVTVIKKAEDNAAGSTDMGNVSHVVPSIHPLYNICMENEANHTREFTEAANTPGVHEKTLIVAKALSLTCIDVLVGGDNVLI